MLKSKEIILNWKNILKEKDCKVHLIYRQNFEIKKNEKKNA